MALTKEKKAEVLKKISDAVKSSQSMVFVNFHGLTVSKATKMRQALRTANVGYTVAKKTLARKALTDGGITGEVPELPGEMAFAYADDLTAPAREVYKFQKEFKDSLSIVGGVFSGRFMNKTEMMEIALIPPTETLRGMFVNVINSPIQGLVIALNAIAGTKTSA